jgi:hypothetical protein
VINLLIVDWPQNGAPGDRSLAFPCRRYGPDYTRSLRCWPRQSSEGWVRLAFEEYSSRGTPTMVRAQSAATGRVARR